MLYVIGICQNKLTATGTNFTYQFQIKGICTCRFVDSIGICKIYYRKVRGITNCKSGSILRQT